MSGEPWINPTIYVGYADRENGRFFKKLVAPVAHVAHAAHAAHVVSVVPAAPTESESANAPCDIVINQPDDFLEENSEEDDNSYLPVDFGKTIYEDEEAKVFADEAEWGDECEDDDVCEAKNKAETEKYAKYGGKRRYAQRLTHIRLFTAGNTEYQKNPIEYEQKLCGNIPVDSHTEWEEMRLEPFGRVLTNIPRKDAAGKVVGTHRFVMKSYICGLYYLSAEMRKSDPSAEPELVLMISNTEGKYINDGNQRRLAGLPPFRDDEVMDILSGEKTSTFDFVNKSAARMYEESAFPNGYIANQQMLGPDLIILTIPTDSKSGNDMRKLITLVINTIDGSVVAKHVVDAHNIVQRNLYIAMDNVTGERVVKIVDKITVEDNGDTIITFIFISASGTRSLEFENCFSFYGDTIDPRIYSAQALFVGKAKPSELTEEYSDYIIPVRFNMTMRELSFSTNPCGGISWREVDGKLFVRRDFYDLGNDLGCVKNDEDPLGIRNERFPAIDRNSRSINLELVYRLNMIGAYPMLYDHRKKWVGIHLSYESALMLWKDNMGMFSK